MYVEDIVEKGKYIHPNIIFPYHNVPFNRITAWNIYTEYMSLKTSNSIKNTSNKPNMN